MEATATTQLSFLYKGKFDTAHKLARHLIAAGIPHQVNIASESKPDSWNCCYVVAVANDDLEKAKNVIADKRAEHARSLYQQQIDLKAKIRQKAKRAAKARKKNRRK